MSHLPIAIGDALGESVATAGDVNGDGFSDVIVSVRGFDNGELNEGAAFLYLGRWLFVGSCLPQR